MKKTYLATAVAALFAAPITTAIAADTLLDDVVVSSSRSEQRSFDALMEMLNIVQFRQKRLQHLFACLLNTHR
jgi:outer membrane cobalamin receptor